MFKRYTESIEKKMKNLYETLSEKGRRLFAGVEAEKLPRGGQRYLSKLLGCDRKTIKRGMVEMENLEELPTSRIRKEGGGRKRILETHPEIEPAFVELLSEHTAGDPMDEEVRWTELNTRSIASKLQAKGLKVSPHLVKQLLRKHHYVKRSLKKQLSTGSTQQRDEQFTNIVRLIAEYKQAGCPILSIDTKKKELLGRLYRTGQVYTTKGLKVYDHDYVSLADGKAIPHTIYDLQQNTAYVNIGTSHETAEFIGDSLKHWWKVAGKSRYAWSPAILLLTDAGGADGYRNYTFKQELVRLVNEIGVPIRVAHYPSYCSKWNPVEHRVFPHITRAMAGAMLTNHQLVKKLIEQTSTKTGLKVIVNIIDQVYQIGQKVSEEFKETMPIIFDEILGKWNYQAIPHQF